MDQKTKGAILADHRARYRYAVRQVREIQNACPWMDTCPEECPGRVRCLRRQEEVPASDLGDSQVMCSSHVYP